MMAARSTPGDLAERDVGGRRVGDLPSVKGVSSVKRCELARAFLWEYSHKGLELVQCLGRHGASLTW
jgi:hypothetical protein